MEGDRDGQEIRFLWKRVVEFRHTYAAKIARSRWRGNDSAYIFSACVHYGYRTTWFMDYSGSFLHPFPDTEDGRKDAEELAEKFIWRCESQIGHSPKRNCAFNNPSQFHELLQRRIQ